MQIFFPIFKWRIFENHYFVFLKNKFACQKQEKAELDQCSLLVFIRARCVRVRQKLVPRNLSATHNLALNFRSVPALKIKGIGISQLNSSFMPKMTTWAY